jgi:hypothetical protein
MHTVLSSQRFLKPLELRHTRQAKPKLGRGVIMQILSLAARKVMSVDAPERLMIMLAGCLLVVGSAHAQAPAAKAKADTGGEPSGFSIESEMLTYRALESNSAAVACDVAGFLDRSSVKPSDPAGTFCDLRGGSKQSKVILLPFDQSTFANFQIWRGDMATMRRLQEEARKVGCAEVTRGGSATASAAASTSALLNLTPAGPALNLATGVLGMMASEESTSSVAGTIEDQAFLNGVGRQLQALKVKVIMPKTFSPYSLLEIDTEASPFLGTLDQTLKDEVCLKSKDSSDPAIAYTIAAFERFRCMLGDTSDPAPANAEATGAKGGKRSSSCESTGAAEGTTTVQKKSGGDETESSGGTANSAANHLSAVLSADGLAQALYDDNEIPAEDVHILLLKALESGGSVEKRSNILGTKIRYSGGAVGTYALFKMDGGMECSGNVFDYGGSIKAKNFQRDLKNYNPDPGKQVIFLHGNCGAIAPGQ